MFCSQGLCSFSCVALVEEPTHNAVILHEDKQYYPSAGDLYGADVETLVQEEDAQPLTEPIIAPIKVRKWTVEEKDMPQTRFDKRCVVCFGPPLRHYADIASQLSIEYDRISRNDSQRCCCGTLASWKNGTYGYVSIRDAQVDMGC